MKVWYGLAFIILATITVVLAVVSIWTGDQRWGETASVFGILALIPGIIRFVSWSME